MLARRSGRHGLRRSGLFVELLELLCRSLYRVSQTQRIVLMLQGRPLGMLLLRMSQLKHGICRRQLLCHMSKQLKRRDYRVHALDPSSFDIFRIPPLCLLPDPLRHYLPVLDLVNLWGNIFLVLCLRDLVIFESSFRLHPCRFTPLTITEPPLLRVHLGHTFLNSRRYFF